MMTDRMKQQFQFIIEIDKLKTIFRQSYLIDGERKENDAEHSWYLAMLAITFEEYAAEPVDLLRVIKLVLIHDLVEIDAGDTFVYDVAGNATKKARETAAAERIFPLLPADQAAEIRALWDEFEEAATPEAKFANALDRIAPMLMNYESGGMTWKEHHTTMNAVLKRNHQTIIDGAPQLWHYIEDMLSKAVREEMLIEVL